MLDLTKSAISYWGAMALFTIQEFSNVLSTGARGQLECEGNAAIYSVSQAIQNQFGDLFFGGFQIGDAVQRTMVDLVFDGLTCRAFTPDYISRFASVVGNQAEDTLQVWTSPDNLRLAWQQLKNNYEVFNLVKNAGSLLNIPGDGQDLDLNRLIEEAYALGAYPDLWAVEGLGHEYTMKFFPLWGTGKLVRGLLNKRGEALPDKALTMLHAGLGLAFAQQLMNRITPYSHSSAIRKVLQQFVTLVKNNAISGYEGAAYESLGLVTRFWHPQMVNIVDNHIREIEPDATGYFWHGVGRAHYFLPLYFVPGLLSPWLAVQLEAPYELALLNMISGLSWAMAIVNIRQPRIMENFLKYHGDKAAQTPAFSNGIVSALIMGIDTTPRDVYITSFLEHEPDQSDPRVVHLWDQVVHSPASEALERIYPVLKRRHRLGEVFRYQNLSELARRLEGRGWPSAALARS